MNEQDLQEYLASIEQLPSLPLVIRQVQKIMDNPRSNMNQIAQVIAKDQALASKTIKLVNSAFYGLSKKVSSITQAIIILGLNTVNNLMMALSVIKMFKKTGVETFDPEKFWIHSFGTGLIARSIATKALHGDPEVCFIAGLLHDIGRLIFDQFMHEPFHKAYTLSRQRNIPLFEAESEIFGADHAFCGGCVTDRWKIPTEIVAAIKYHHAPLTLPVELEKYKKGTIIVAMANSVAIKENIGNSGDNNIAPDSWFTSLKIDTKTMNTILEKVKAEIKTTIQEWYR